MPESNFHAMVLVAPRAFEKQQRTVPTLGPNEVLIRAHYAGVCGTDLALFNGQYEVPLPLVLGHEFSGRVKAVGDDVSEHWIGRRVVADINNTCRSYKRDNMCPECQRQNSNHCRERTVLGIIEADGAFAEYIRVPAYNLHPIPDVLSDQVAVLVEPMAAALQTFVKRPLEPNERVVVMGAGRLGGLIVAAAKSKGAEVIAISRHAKRRAFAQIFGADHVLAPSPTLSSEIRELWGGELADVVVDATGHPDGLQAALECVRPCGTLCLKTTVGQPSTLAMTRIVVDEIQLSSSRCGSFSEAIHFLEQNPFPFDEWFQGTYPLSQLGSALQAAQEPGKILIDLQHTASI